MKHLSTDKRNKLILVVLGTVTAICAIYFFLISPQLARNALVKSKIASQKGQLDQMLITIKSAGTSANVSDTTSSKLAVAEADVAWGDLFAWTYDTIRKFKADYQVSIPAIGQPQKVPNDIFPDFPYQQIKFTLNGTGYYQDIGTFISGLENKFPHMRVINLSIEPAGGLDSTSEKLAFRMDVVALIKTNA